MNKPKILIDGVIFQLQHNKPGGISRVWRNHLQHLGKTELRENALLLDRAGTCPEFPGLKSIPVRPYDPLLFDADPLYLQEIMEAEEASLLISTYYTFPERGPCLIMLYDMTPEIMGLDLNFPEWRAKTRAIGKAGGYLSISQSTKRDFLKLHPENQGKPITVVPNAASSVFQNPSRKVIDQFKSEYQIQKPYFLLVGNRSGYKNAQIFFKAFGQIKNREDYEIFCTGGQARLESAFKPYLGGSRCQVQHLSDQGLAAAYAGAVCLIYPSLYEGFGLPILEAQQCGCPVITYDHSSLKEVGGEGALYPALHDTSALHEALLEVQEPELREDQIRRGYQNAARFSWSESSRILIQAITHTLNDLDAVPENPPDPLNSGPRFVYHLSKQPGRQDLSRLLDETARLISSNPLSVDFAPLAQREKRIQQKLEPAVLAELKELSSTPDCGGLIHYWLGLGYRKQGSNYQALEAYLAALRTDLNSARIAYLAAELAGQLQEWKLATKFWQTMVRLHYPGAEDRLEQIQREARSAGRSPRQEHNQLHWIRVLEKPPSVLAPVNSSGQQPLVSIILPTKDRKQGAVDFLKSLPQGLQGLPYEVLVYAGDIPEEDLRSWREAYPIHRIYEDEEIFPGQEPFSWAKLMNHGFEQARGEWILYGSDDIVLYPQAVPLAVSRASRIPRVGGMTFLHRNTVQSFGEYYKHFGYDVFDHKTFINFGLIRREAYQYTAGFDESFRFYWADVDLCLQIWKAGFRIGASPYSLVDHHNREDAIRKGNARERYRQDTEVFFQKWHQDPLFKGPHVLDRDRYVLSEENAQRVIAYLNSSSQTVRPFSGGNGRSVETGPGLSRSSPRPDGRGQAARILESILNAPDVADAVQEYQSELSPKLISLIQENARQAEQDGDTELADGLDVLSEYIREQIPS